MYVPPPGGPTKPTPKFGTPRKKREEEGSFADSLANSLSGESIDVVRIESLDPDDQKKDQQAPPNNPGKKESSAEKKSQLDIEV